MKDIIFYVGAFDAVTIVILGIVAAGMRLTGTDSEFFYGHVAPAIGILVGTSFVAGIAMAITRWLSGT